MRYRMHLQLEKSLQPNTVDAYLSDVNKLVDFLGGDDKALEATLEELRAFLASLARLWLHATNAAVPVAIVAAAIRIAAITLTLVFFFFFGFGASSSKLLRMTSLFFCLCAFSLLRRAAT